MRVGRPLAAWLDVWGGRGTRREHDAAVAELAARHAVAIEHYRAGRVATALPLLE